MKQLGDLERDATKFSRILCGSRDDSFSAAQGLQSLRRSIHAEDERRDASSFESLEDAERGWIVYAENGAYARVTVQNDPSHFASCFASVVAVQAIDDPNSRKVAQGAEKAADPIEIACDAGPPDDNDLPGTSQRRAQMPSNEFARLDIVRRDNRIRAARACIDGHDWDPTRPNRRYPICDPLRIDGVEDHGVSSRSSERPELLDLTPQRLARIEHCHVHSGGCAGRPDRVRLRMKERIGEILNDERDRLEARRIVKLGRREFGDTNSDPVPSRRVPPQEAFRHKRFADVEETALRGLKAPCDIGQG